MTVLEGFAGPGGWSEGLRLSGITDAVGIEIDGTACATAEQAGHRRVCADLSYVDLTNYLGVEGVVLSPPCQSFSSAGKGLGKLDRPRLEAHVKRIAEVGRWVHYSREGWHDDRSPLVLEPLRFVLTLRPAWVALEQVPQVLPLWDLYAQIFLNLGYGSAVGNLTAEQYGVPQTRKRAILVAVKGRAINLPSPTHRKYRKGVDRAAGDQSLLPWVSMADALGWTGDGFIRSNYGTGGDPAARGERGFGEPAAAVTTHVNRNMVMRSSCMTNATVRAVDEPAPTITAGHDRGDRVWVQTNNETRLGGGRTERYERDVEAPSPTVTEGTKSWSVRSGRLMVQAGATSTMVDPRPSSAPAGAITGKGTAAWIENEAPAITVSGDPRIAPRGHHDRQMNGATRVSVQEAAILQSFRADYPWQGSKTQQYRQVGDAVPPLLARAILSSVVS